MATSSILGLSLSPWPVSPPLPRAIWAKNLWTLVVFLLPNMAYLESTQHPCPSVGDRVWSYLGELPLPHCLSMYLGFGAAGSHPVSRTGVEKRCPRCSRIYNQSNHSGFQDICPLSFYLNLEGCEATSAGAILSPQGIVCLRKKPNQTQSQELMAEFDCLKPGASRFSSWLNWA